MNNKYYPPSYNKDQFHCPICNVFAKQRWSPLYADGNFVKSSRISFCDHCQSPSIWYDEKLIYPDLNTAPPANENLPPDCVADYNEAASILSKSPRGAAALLRLSLQKLMICLGETGKDINSDIGALVKKGLHPNVQRALDIVRVVGNESVHPGTIDMQDNFETALSLFDLINFIVSETITREKSIDKLYSSLPQSKLEGIRNRDSVKTT